jgi:hypothetical protein
MIRLTCILVVGLIAASCNTSKNTVVEQSRTESTKETSQTTEPSNEAYLLGEVQFLDCGVVIQVTSGEKKTICVPTNLDPKFQVDKLRLKLRYKVLDQKGTTCSEFPAIEIKEVFAVR